jgi:REP element-mobilizing transposase RayT
MAHTYTNLLTHLIFSTRQRAPCMDRDLRARLFPYMGGIIRELGGRPLLINGTADHVHCLVTLPPTIATSDALRVLKANSSGWVHQTWPSRAEFRWQVGYGAFSVSRANARGVEQYIARQEEHHRKVTFQEEFVAILKSHGVEYDERYLWD